MVAEHTTSGDRWRGEFTGAYVEAIAEKTGNPKRFPVFLRILFSAIRQESSSVFIDLLTYQDLEAMKQSRGGAGGQRALSSRDPANNKRYVIVTYASEFDRVHYPLPLMYEGRVERRPEAEEAGRELPGAFPYDSHALAGGRKKSQRGVKAGGQVRAGPPVRLAGPAQGGRHQGRPRGRGRRRPRPSCLGRGTRTGGRPSGGPRTSQPPKRRTPSTGPPSANCVGACAT